MYLSTLMAVVAMLSTSGLVAALPTEEVSSTDILKREEKGSEQDPYILDISCKDVEEVCEARCLSFLCFESPNPYQYDSSDEHNNDRRSESGYAIAFEGDDKKRKERGTDIPPDHKDWKSAEETVRASAKQGGWGTPLVPVSSSHNRVEGARYSGALKKVKAKTDDWVKDHFTDLKPDMKYCNAYQKSTPDKSVCKSDNKNDPINFIYWKTHDKKGNVPQFHKLEYGKDTWDNGPRA